MCRTCPTPCVPLPNALDLKAVCPLAAPRWPAVDMTKAGFGDWVAKFATPVARVLKLKCIDAATGQLKPDSGCAQRKELYNAKGRQAVAFLKKMLPHA